MVVAGGQDEERGRGLVLVEVIEEALAGGDRAGQAVCVSGGRPRDVAGLPGLAARACCRSDRRVRVWSRAQDFFPSRRSRGLEDALRAGAGGAHSLPVRAGRGAA